MEFVIVVAHKENINETKRYLNINYPTKKVDCLFLPEDHGYHLGTMKNVYTGVKYIKDNK